MIEWYITYTSISAIYKKYSDHSEKKDDLNKNNKKTFPINDVGMSKPNEHANKVRWDPKLNKPLQYIQPYKIRPT